MKPILTISIFILLISSCSSEHKNRNDLFYDQVKGKVSKLTMIFYDVVEKSGVIEKDRIQARYIFDFNTAGNITKQTEITLTDSNLSTTIQTVFSFDDKGQKIAARHSNKSKPYLTCIYDKEGRLKETYSFEDEKGALLSKTELRDKDSIFNEESEYTPDGKLISKTISKRTGGLTTEVKKYDATGKLMTQTDFIYNSQGTLIKRKDIMNNQSFERSYKYSNFDDKGNYLISTSYNDGKPFQIEERLIEYY